jgi:hypothetical protein
VARSVPPPCFSSVSPSRRTAASRSRISESPSSFRDILSRSSSW